MHFFGSAKSKKEGFTLIELSIVLVIIGLIVGGVLVGQDLIRAAEIRSTIGQVEKFNTAVTTFKVKFNYLPGDMPPDQAAQLGLFSFTGAIAGTTDHGDNNGYVDPDEGFIFWRQLSEATLIEGNYGTTGNAAIDPTTGLPIGDVSPVSLSFPPGKLASTYYAVAGGTLQNPYSIDPALSYRGNFYQLAVMPSITQGGGLNFNLRYMILPVDSHAIDAKIDDGYPGTGHVWAKGLNTHCATTDASNNNVYNMAVAPSGNFPGCELFFLW